MPNIFLHLTTPRNRQARSVQEAQIAAVDLDLGELELLGLTVAGDTITTSNASIIVRTLELVPSARYVEQIPTEPERSDTLKGMFASVVGMTCFCTTTPTLT